MALTPSTWTTHPGWMTGALLLVGGASLYGLIATHALPYPSLAIGASAGLALGASFYLIDSKRYKILIALAIITALTIPTSLGYDLLKWRTLLSSAGIALSLTALHAYHKRPQEFSEEKVQKALKLNIFPALLQELMTDAINTYNKLVSNNMLKGQAITVVEGPLFVTQAVFDRLVQCMRVKIISRAVKETP